MRDPLDLAAIQRRIDHGTVTRADAQALMDRVRELERDHIDMDAPAVGRTIGDVLKAAVLVAVNPTCPECGNTGQRHAFSMTRWYAPDPRVDMKCLACKHQWELPFLPPQ